jgi:integrase/recombinase XerD
MSSHQPCNESWLSRLDSHLRIEGYSQNTIKGYLAESRRFLEYLAKRSTAVEAVELSAVSRYLRRELRRFCRRHGHPPRSRYCWHSVHASCIHMLLRVVKGQWPPISGPSTPLETFHHQICQDYAQWLSTLRGLAVVTIYGLRDEAERFLSWLDERGGPDRMSQLTAELIDAYLNFRAPPLCRQSRHRMATNLRSILRYLHMTGRISRDLAPFVVAPKLYAIETIPSALRDEDVRAVVRTTEQDRSAKGLRDYAILMLLCTYGLRAGELTHLRLEDIDWRRETLRIRHSKTGAESFLPLLGPVGEAILAYLRTGRPKTSSREIFIRALAPHRPLRSLYTLVQSRLQEAEIHPVGKRGPHAFRHARAGSLLRGGICAKQIGDILGHRSSASTTVYLKLATEDLRCVALEIPGEVKPS